MYNTDEDGYFCITMRWTVEDVKTLRPDMTNKDAEAFLLRNRSHIEDRMCETGWTILENHLDVDAAFRN